MRVLYSSEEVSAAIAEVLADSEPDDRRVAMVAFVGAKSERFLPDPIGLEIVCWLQPGATDAAMLDALQLRGAQIFKSDRLHTKIYWSSRKGCVICSANASAAAQGGSGQKEAGVFLPKGSVDIQRFWDEAAPQPVGKADLAKLARQGENAPRVPGMGSPAQASDFSEWRRRQWQAWKLCGYYGSVKLSKSAKSKAQKTFGATDPYNWLDEAEGVVKPREWLLMFDLSNLDKSDMEWLRPDFVVKVPKGDPGYIKGWEHQSVEVHRHGSHAEPFKLSQKFKTAFRLAVNEYGEEKIGELGTVVAPAKLLTLIAKNYGD
jgi:hypothetical protein